MTNYTSQYVMLGKNQKHKSQHVTILYLEGQNGHLEKQFVGFCEDV